MTDKALPEYTTRQLKEVLETTDLVVISCASIEPHGPHLPLAADSLQGDRLIREIAKKLTAAGEPAIAGPVIPFGLLTNQFERSVADPGNLAIRADTLKALLIDLTRSMMRDGFRRFVWVMSHVENEALMHVAAKELADEHGASIVVANWIQHVNTVYPDVLHGSPVQGHAGEGETARVLAIRPDLVDLEGVEGYYPEPSDRPEFSQLTYFGGGIGVYHPTGPDESPGYIGEPHLATAADGEVLIDAMADWIARSAAHYLGGR